MKSNNKLQYLQKLASKNQQQQSGGPKKPSQSLNLVGIGQSMGQPYITGPRFGQKQVKHQPKNNSVGLENHHFTRDSSNKKFTLNKKSNSKSVIVVSKDLYQMNMEITDPRYDQFEPIKMALGIFEDEDVRKNNRKNQMAKRQQKLLKQNEKGILKSKAKGPDIKFEQVDDEYQEKKIRKQVSISEEPRKGQSPGMPVKKVRKLKRNASGGESNASLQIGQNPNSELTVSSVGKHPDDPDDNSIISEEDSAFEDQTPAARKNKAAAQDASFTIANQANQQRGDNTQSRCTNLNLKNDEAVVGNMKAYIRQKTLGWKQTNHDTTRWPFKRSPTHKSRNGDQESQNSKKRFGIKVNGINKKKEKGFAQQSRHSSLNYTVDNQMDQLSVNVNRNLMFTKGANNTAGSNLESQSVASVISKGGTVISPFKQKKNSGSIKFLAKSTSKSSSMNIQVSARATKKEIMAGEQNIDKQDASKTHVRFGEDPLYDDMDVRKSYYKNNQKMINIYLKTPYKVLTIDQIKSKEKVDRDREFIDNVSPNRLFIAENNLKIHTLFREKNKYATSKGKFKKNLIYVSGDEDNSSQKLGKKAYSTVKNHLIKDHSISQITDSLEQKNIESEPNFYNSSQDVLSDIQLTSSQLKELKTKKNQLEIEFKKKFYNQLQNQLEKRIEQVKFQTNILAKQKNLFAIYGNMSPDHNKTVANNVSMDTIQAGYDLDDFPSNTNDQKFKQLQASQKKYKTASKADESMLARGESPSKLSGAGVHSVLKGSISRIQEPALVKQSTNVSKYSRMSDADNTKEDDVKDQDEDEKEHRVTSYSYDFDIQPEASLKKLLSMSNSLGYSQVQIRELKEKQRELEEAEKKLQKQQIMKSQTTSEAYFNTRNINQNTSGSFIVNNDKPKKIPPKFSVNTRSKTDKKPIRTQVLQSIKERDSIKNDEMRSLDNDDTVKDYFDNKISLRRSIEKKLHYDSKVSQSKAAGHNYPTSAQKHQQLLADLKNIKKERIKAYENQGDVKHHRIKTNASIKQDMVLPDIHAQQIYMGESLRKQKSNIKESQQPLDENFYPLKKSGTQNEKKIHDVGFSPIRMQRHNVVAAYNIQTSNQQFLAMGPNESSLIKTNNSSKKHLGFQFMNKSPRPSILSNGLQKDSSFTFEKDQSPQKSSKFILNKQSQLMKGVLSNGRKNRIMSLKNKDLNLNLNLNETSQGKLPQINQSSSYAPGQ